MIENLPLSGTSANKEYAQSREKDSKKEKHWSC